MSADQGENLFLLFTYQVDLRDIQHESFEMMQNRLKWSFDVFWDEIQNRNQLKIQQDDFDFHGYIFPFLNSNQVWQPFKKAAEENSQNKTQNTRRFFGKQFLTCPIPILSPLGIRRYLPRNRFQV